MGFQREEVSYAVRIVVDLKTDSAERYEATMKD